MTLGMYYNNHLYMYQKKYCHKCVFLEQYECGIPWEALAAPRRRLGLPKGHIVPWIASLIYAKAKLDFLLFYFNDTYIISYNPVMSLCNQLILEIL